MLQNVALLEEEEGEEGVEGGEGPILAVFVAAFVSVSRLGLECFEIRPSVCCGDGRTASSKPILSIPDNFLALLLFHPAPVACQGPMHSGANFLFLPPT